MSFRRFEIWALNIVLAFGLSACGTTTSEVTDPPQVQAAAIKSQGGAYKVGNPYKIFGRWYYPKEDYSYSEEGTASWYGPDFHAKKTANNEDYNMHTLTAAHRTLPLPSIVKVTNLDNGRSLVLRVNDRGPYARERIIDISKKGAQLLGFMENGTARVRVEVLEKESKNLKSALLGETMSDSVDSAPVGIVAKNEIGKIGEPAPIKAAKIVADKPVVAIKTAEPAKKPIKEHKVVASGYYVQAGAFSNQTMAKNLQQKLEQFGSTHIMKANVNGTTFHRVRVGPFTHHQEAIVAQSKIRNYGISAANIIEE